jgi:hypothetical protein
MNSKRHTVDEAAAILRIGRSLADELANQYLLSSGMVGMPAYRLDSCIRVPRWALMVLAKTGRVVGSERGKPFDVERTACGVAPTRLMTTR